MLTDVDNTVAATVGRPVADDAREGSSVRRVCFMIMPPERYSGATFHAIWLAQKLAQWNVEVEFLAFERKARKSECTPEGFPVHYLPCGAGRFAELPLWLRLLGFFQRHPRFDVVHVHRCTYRDSFVPIAAGAAGIASVASVMLQGSDLGATARLETVVRNRLIRLYDRVVPISAETYREALEAGMKPERLVRIPIGVDCERFRPAPEETRRRLREELGLPLERPVVAFIGAFNERKNVVWLVDAWLDRPETIRGAHLLLVGDAVGGPEGESEGWEVRRQIEARLPRAGSSVHWIPFVREIERVYQAVDALVLPSLAEGMPSVVLQAMASELPVVATPVAGVPELLGERNERGWLFDVNDRHGLWQGLHTLLKNDALRRAVGRAARNHVVAHCSLERVADRHLELYGEVVRGRRASRRRDGPRACRRSAYR